MGKHDVLTSKPGQIHIGKDGKVRLITKSNELALSGQFKFILEFSEEDLNELMLAGIRAPLEKNILEIEDRLRNPKKKI